MIWFTADEHYGHTNIIKYCNRPFSNVDEMDDSIIKNHNSVVDFTDTVYHVGDFTLRDSREAENYIRRLNGNHIFIDGSHDKWLDRHPRNRGYMIEIKHNGQLIIACHYAMRRWPRSHYGSWQVYGHTHGRLAPEGLQWDVGIDNNKFFPISFDNLKSIFDKWIKDNPDWKPLNH
jgi:calcineurin-like phosphoesterase family protein